MNICIYLFWSCECVSWHRTNLWPRWNLFLSLWLLLIQQLLLSLYIYKTHKNRIYFFLYIVHFRFPNYVFMSIIIATKNNHFCSLIVLLLLLLLLLETMGGHSSVPCRPYHINKCMQFFLLSPSLWNGQLFFDIEQFIHLHNN